MRIPAIELTTFCHLTVCFPFLQLTYFWQNGAEGACGHKHPDSFPLVALMGGMWSESNCGQVVNVCSVNNRGYCVKAVVADACIGDEEDCPIEIDGRVHMGKSLTLVAVFRPRANLYFINLPSYNTHVDASAGLFEAFAPLSEGVVDVYLEVRRTWSRAFAKASSTMSFRSDLFVLISIIDERQHLDVIRSVMVDRGGLSRRGARRPSFPNRHHEAWRFPASTH